ncbi:alginate lyase family protein [Pleomorphomonas sp. PLEO]|uniref:alginate lyase family protein n=1 Tax=Pleomorphomonas sp. PLEO TaxID=3239306 RepID=UPI00351F4FCA
MRSLLIALLSLMTMAGLAASSSAKMLPPFSPRSPSDFAIGKECAAPPAPVVNLKVISKYGNDGPERDTVDPEADRAFQAQMAPIRAFSQTVVKMANRYTEHGGAADARCALTWLRAWAEGQALSRMDNPNAEFERAQILAGLGMALIQISPAVEGDARLASVTKWMAELATSTDTFFGATRDKLRGSRNNHAYWAALASAAVAVAADDRKLLDWAVETYKAGVRGATAQGGLPLELARGKKAREYHLFALNALVPVAAFAEANGIPAYNVCDGALHKIVHFTLQSIANPATMTAAAGKAQEPFPKGLPPAQSVAFLELYHRAFPGTAPMEPQLLALRPFIATNLGGNQTLLYGR